MPLQSNIQTNLFEVHRFESSFESQIHLDENRVKFSQQGKKVFNMLLNGKELSVYEALVNSGISSLPRRILDLKQNGVVISDKWILNDDGKRLHKVWFMIDFQIKFNREKFLG